MSTWQTRIGVDLVIPHFPKSPVSIDAPDCRHGKAGKCGDAWVPASVPSLMGPVMSSLPVRQTPDSASVDGHSSFPLRERSCPMGRGCNVCSQVSPAGYLLLSVVSAKVAASMMRLERGVVRQSMNAWFVR